MKRCVFMALIAMLLVEALPAQEHRRYVLKWNDEFDAETLDKRVWSKVWRSEANWAVHMTSDERLYGLEDGDLVLRGMVNDFLPNDKAPYLTGGVWSRYKKSFGFGRIEVRAKFDVAQGFWPAIWMLPETNNALDWPYGGEIDIMEHFRDNPFVNQTVHSNYTVNLGQRNRPSQVAYPAYKVGDYNTYAMERFHDSLVFFVNGEHTLNYPRFRKGNNGQFPFSQHDFYLILDAQLGYDRSPSVDESKLPVELRIDYVRYYEVDTKTDAIPEPKEYQQFTKNKKKYRKTVFNAKETFDNPDEYRIVVKCGKATISGNAVWAQSTLSQLVDEQGMIANLEVHDWATCPYRGISLEKYEKKLTFKDLNRLLEVMALYKLNYLQWNGAGYCSEEESNQLRECAHDLGIAIVPELSAIPNADIIDFEDLEETSASNRVFLHNASKNGGWLFLRGRIEDELEVMMAFAERYWQGGNAGKTEEEAGSRLANFEEKMTICRERFEHGLTR